jgi:hypothetical protein
MKNFDPSRVARNLYVAVQPAVEDVRWLSSEMDFRSNEAGRTASGIEAGASALKPTSARSHSVSR